MRIIYFLIITFLISCTPSKKLQFTRTGEVECEDYTTSVITVRSTARASDLSGAVYYAERNAFENLLFKGIPDCNLRTPLIENEGTFMSRYKSEFEQLINSNYVKYIVKSSTLNSNTQKGITAITQLITIDLSALRKDLESRGIIRKFGI